MEWGVPQRSRFRSNVAGHPTRRSTALTVALGLAFAAGIVLRAWALRLPLGASDSDEAVWALMTRHVLDGEFPAYFWGQGYGGTIEVYLGAPLMWAFGGGLGAARALALLLTAVATCLVWVVGRRALDARRAAVAAALFWVWPAYAAWKSTRVNGFYLSGQILGLLVILLVLRLAERPGRRDAVLLGLVLGLAAWQTCSSSLSSYLRSFGSRGGDRLPIASPRMRCRGFSSGPAGARVQPPHDGWSAGLRRAEAAYHSRLQGFFTAALPRSSATGAVLPRLARAMPARGLLVAAGSAGPRARRPSPPRRSGSSWRWLPGSRCSTRFRRTRGMWSSRVTCSCSPR